jgi:4-hydroxymandelate oxidase
MDPALTWDDLDWLASVTRLPVVVKGIVRADDAVRAAERGAAGIVVSNHGGRQLDTSIATLDALEPIAEALAAAAPAGGGGPELLLDGGVRRGTDVLKALALGARAVLIGRPVLWGLALGGSAGVERVLAMLRDELDLALALAGARTPSEVTRDLLV